MGCKEVCSRWVGWCARKDCNLRGRRERNFSTRSARRWLREPLCSAQIHSPLGPFSRWVESWNGGKCLDGHGLRSTGREIFFTPPNSHREDVVERGVGIFVGNVVARQTIQELLGGMSLRRLDGGGW